MSAIDDNSSAKFVDTVLEPAAIAEAVHGAPGARGREATRVAALGEGRVAKRPAACAVVVAGGHGERLGYPGGKQLMPILGRPLLTWCLQAFDTVDQIGCIIVCCPAERIEEYRRVAVEPFGLVTPVDFVAAGELRQESAMNGVEAVPDEYGIIVMHDGARPLILPDTVTHAINMLKGTIDADGVVCGHPAIDTLKVIDGDAVVGTPDRSMFWIAQTPQVFRADILRQAHIAAMEEGFIGTDDSSLVERVGGRVLLVSCPRDNIKLTVPEDVAQVVASLRQRYGITDAPEAGGPEGDGR